MVKYDKKQVNILELDNHIENDLQDFNDDLFIGEFIPSKDINLDANDISFCVEDTSIDKQITLKKYEYNKHVLNIKLSVYTDNFKPNNLIRIETNMITFNQLIDFINLNNLEFLVEENELYIKKQKSVQFNGEINLALNNDNSIFVIKGFYNLIESLYDYFLEIFKQEFIYIEKMNIFENIMNKIYSYDTDTTSILLYKILPFSLSSKLKNNNILVIEDIEKLDVKKFYFYEFESILRAFENKILKKPKVIFDNVVSCLKKKQIDILKMRSTMTLEEVGKYYNCTRERIRQIEKKAIDRISKCAGNDDLNESIRLYSKNFLIFTDQIFDSNNLSLYLIDKINDENSFYKSNILDNIYFSGSDEREIVEFFLENMPEVINLNEIKSFIKDILNALSEVNKSYYFCYDEVEQILKLYYKNDYGLFISKYKMPKTYIFPIIVREFFKDGIDIYDQISLDKFKSIAKEKFKYDISLSSNRAISAVLQKCLILKDRGFYFYQDNIVLIDDILKSKISHYIIDNKNPVISYKEIYEFFNEDLKKLDIDNRYYLAAQMKLINIPNITYSRDYIFKGDFSSVTDIYKEVEKFITKSSELVTKELLESKFPFIKYTTFQNLLNNTSIINMNGYFTTIKKLNISTEEYKVINDTLESIIDNTKIYHARELFRKSKKNLDFFYGRNGIDHYLKFYYLVNKLLPTKYGYNRPYIASHEIKMLSGLQQLIERIVSNKKCSISGDIRMFAQEIGYYIDCYLDLIITNNDSIIFADQNNVITLKEAGIKDENFESIDSILKEFMANSDYRPLSQFYLNWKLPKIGIPWNEWVLASIINKYSEKYYVTFSSKTLSEAHPLIVDNEIEEENIDFSKIKFNKSSDYDVEIDFDFL